MHRELLSSQNLKLNFEYPAFLRKILEIFFAVKSIISVNFSSLQYKKFFTDRLALDMIL